MVSERGKKEGAVRPGAGAINSAAESQRREAQDAEAGDAYHSFRGEALQLTRRWQSAARKATSAFSGGGTAHGSTHVRTSIAAGSPVREPSKVSRVEALGRSRHDLSFRARDGFGPIGHVSCAGGSHSEARKFAREARHLREKALKAHELAAARIEEANNACKGHDQWTLDLHGLHGTEAVSAVDRR